MATGTTEHRGWHFGRGIAEYGRRGATGSAVALLVEHPAALLALGERGIPGIFLLPIGRSPDTIRGNGLRIADTRGSRLGRLSYPRTR
jgi:hypothetical protein